MTAQAQPQPAIAVVLVDDDFIFRTGLRVWLTQQANVTVEGEADRERTALTLIEQALNGDRPDASNAELPSQTDDDGQPEVVSVAVVSLSLGQASTPAAPAFGVLLADTLRQRYPSLPIVMFAASLDAATLDQLHRIQVNGFVHKSAPPDEWLRSLKRVVAGETVLPDAASLTVPLSSSPTAPATSPASERAIARPFALLRRNLRQSGIRQIEADLATVLAQLDHPNLERLDRLIIEGQCRELRTARWIVSHLLATPRLQETQETESTSSEVSSRGSSAEAEAQRLSRDSMANRPGSSTEGDRPDPGGALVGAGIEATLFNGAMTKINGNLTNQSGIVLEIDILSPSKKRQLLYVVVRQIMELLDDLKLAQITSQQLFERRSLVLRDLWQRVVEEFFGRYYTIPMQSSEIEVVGLISEGADTAQSRILDDIPYSIELLAHLLFREPLQADSVAYLPGTPEAMMRAEQLLDHLIVQVGNSIVQPLLNQLGDVEEMKQTFYDRSLISSREITRFRNALSWRYRTDELVQTPMLIFESKYRLFTINGGGIRPVSIYAPRRAELERLEGFPFLVTLALELRDAIAPQLRAVVSWVGSGFIYVLTDVLGRGIGLIVRGVIKGIGSAWQDVRLSRDADQRRL
ncbi:MAG: DUF3685 domain-containing protein [Elainellaceae cyanobacterium]